MQPGPKMVETLSASGAFSDMAVELLFSLVMISKLCLAGERESAGGSAEDIRTEDRSDRMEQIDGKK